MTDDTGPQDPIDIDLAAAAAELSGTAMTVLLRITRRLGQQHSPNADTADALRRTAQIGQDCLRLAEMGGRLTASVRVARHEKLRPDPEAAERARIEASNRLYRLELLRARAAAGETP
jgi:hypothetical protein